ncbi:MAG: hypothetical protein LBQ54_09655 [Planctomycetaceae bacterium]|nr:hypothetical protein [Planctomycetaceae bacterium]
MPVTVYLFVILVFPIIFNGCNRSNHLGTVVVKGTVKVDGLPTEGIEVIFHPASGDGLPAYGQTDGNGNYFLSTAGTKVGSGAVPGEFIPTFNKVTLEHDPRFANREDLIPPPPKVTHHIPKKYSQKRTTDMTPVTVTRNKKNVFDFDLSSK